VPSRHGLNDLSDDRGQLCRNGDGAARVLGLGAEPRPGCRDLLRQLPRLVLVALVSQQDIAIGRTHQGRHGPHLFTSKTCSYNRILLHL
jgi:hypothetical protein